MVSTNQNWLSMSDKSIISTIGAYIKQQRLIQNKTQAKIAETAGVNRWTLSQIEKGKPISLLSLIQILRALNLLAVFENFNIETQVSPLELAKIEKQKRQRASSSETDQQNLSTW